MHHCPVYNVSCILYPLQEMSLFFILHGLILSGQALYEMSRIGIFIEKMVNGCQGFGGRREYGMIVNGYRLSSECD